MDFRQEFTSRWSEIFKPAIEQEPFEGRFLKAVRVDIRKSGDSILTEIMNGIAHSQLVLADVSVTDRWKGDEKPRWSRNGNVMYEVGLALVCRQPVEVILVRDKREGEPLLFDVSTIPVVGLDPDDVTGSINLIRHTILDRLRERDLQKDLRVIRMLRALDSACVFVMKMEGGAVSKALTKSDFVRGPFRPPKAVHGMYGPFTLDEAKRAFSKLQELGIIEPVSFGSEEPVLEYGWTIFGRAALERLYSQAGPRK